MPFPTLAVHCQSRIVLGYIRASSSRLVRQADRLAYGRLTTPASRALDLCLATDLSTLHTADICTRSCSLRRLAVQMVTALGLASATPWLTARIHHGHYLHHPGVGRGVDEMPNAVSGHAAEHGATGHRSERGRGSWVERLTHGSAGCGASLTLVAQSS